VSLTRIVAAVVLLAAALAMVRFSDVAAFTVDQVSIDGANLTDRASVEAAVLADAGPESVFLYDTTAASDRIGHLATVRRAEVRAVLPDRLVVVLEERVPVLLWATGDDSLAFLVDEGGSLIAPAVVGEANVPTIHDERAATAGLAIGGAIAPVDLRVARQLAAVTPAMLGSAALTLVVSVDDREGFVVSAKPDGWRAVFGLYGEVTRGPDLVGVQVQCLASLLAARPTEGVGRIVLSPEGQLCGTYSGPGGS
jgi:cell division septal protein FtsQ